MLAGDPLALLAGLLRDSGQQLRWRDRRRLDTIVERLLKVSNEGEEVQRDRGHVYYNTRNVVQWRGLVRISN